MLLDKYPVLPKPEFNVVAEYEVLLGNLDQLIELAENLESPNAEDEIFVKAAIIGFSHRSPTDQWSRKHFEFAQRRRQEDYSDAELRRYDTNTNRLGMFACLCLGCLLGLAEAGTISEQQIRTAEAHLAGFSMLNLNKIRNG